MALCVCGKCGAIYAPAKQCPHCGAAAEVARFDWEEPEMPKATVEGGASNGWETNPAGEMVPAAEPPPAPKPKPARAKAAAAKEPAEAADITE